MKNSDVIKNIVSDQLCLGCGACVQVSGHGKVDLKLNTEGFLRPVVINDITESEAKAVLNVCPGIRVGNAEKGADYSDLWGPVISTHVGWSTNPDIRYAASSGGGISAALCYLLSNNVVDCVLHSGVSDNDPLENGYKLSTSVEQIVEHCGSRYSPAAPLMGLMQAIERFDRIAFVGKPCDVVALRKLSEENHVVLEKIKYAISFMCAGTPSMKGTEAVLEAFSLNKNDIKSFNYRGDGWPGMATAITKDNEKHQMSYNESWGKILNKNLQVRCKICNDGTGESADITFADAWHGDETGYPSFEEQDGRSLIIVRTRLGSELLSSAVADGSLHIEPFDKERIEEIQPYQAVRKKLIFSRLLAMKLCFQKTPSYPWGDMLRLSLSAGLKKNIVSFAGMTKRIVKLKLGL